MEKLITFPGRSDRGIFTYVIDSEAPFLVKTACEYHPEIAAYINAAKKIPGKTQVLLTALGAGEWWGCNSNGDFFPELELAYPGPEYGYKTFQTNAKIYKHHVNKDPKAAYGDVALSVYNPNYHRVELIVVIDNAKAPDIIEKIDSGEYPEWSMGCRVKYDICSICGNKARVRPEYCEHLRYYMGKIHPATGKMVYAINPKPVFFDISQVFIGADKVAKTLKKVASLTGYHKHAEIRKEIPADEPPASVDNLEDDIQTLKEQDKEMSREVLNEMASKHTLSDILSTLAAARIVPKPQEFQRIILVSTGNRPMADHWDRQNLHFDPSMTGGYGRNVIPIGPEHVNDNIMDLIGPMMPERSFFPPHMMNRIVVMVKRASKSRWKKFASEGQTEENNGMSSAKQLALATIISGLYQAVAGASGKNLAAGVLPEVLLKNPKLTGLLGLGLMTAPIFFGKALTPSTRAPIKMESDRQNFVDRRLPKTASQGMAGLGMTFGSLPAANVLSSYLKNKAQTDPEYTEGSVKKFFRRYPELAAIGGAGVGMGLLTHRPIPSKIYNLISGVGHHVEKAIPHVKTADFKDFALDTMVWPLALGGPHLTHKLVGSAIDQAAFAGLGRLSKKKGNDKINEE